MKSTNKAQQGGTKPMSTNRAKQGCSNEHQQTTTRTCRKTSIEHNKDAPTNTNKTQQGDDTSYEQRKSTRLQQLIKAKIENKHLSTKHTLKYLNIVLIYKENERGNEKNSRVALLVQHDWKPPLFVFFKTLPRNYHNK
jgi:hypothetical protein